MIRTAHVNDIPQMVGLLGELFAIEDDFTIDAEKQSHGLHLLLEKSDAIVLVAVKGEEIIGMASVQSLVSTVMGECVGLIEDVIITEPFRGQGIGKKLLEALIVKGEIRGFRRFALGVDFRNEKAIAFYTHFGFSTSHMGLMYRIRK